ncbi:MAG: carboxypeptidase-like regulatory domain-containing protein [Bacteroidales bacterium]|nr:carboxypeptidase-like regulatory domain-containing protein [Bacteroidales bacterium]
MKKLLFILLATASLALLNTGCTLIQEPALEQADSFNNNPGHIHNLAMEQLLHCQGSNHVESLNRIIKSLIGDNIKTKSTSSYRFLITDPNNAPITSAIIAPLEDGEDVYDVNTDGEYIIESVSNRFVFVAATGYQSRVSDCYSCDSAITLYPLSPNEADNVESLFDDVKNCIEGDSRLINFVSALENCLLESTSLPEYRYLTQAIQTDLLSNPHIPADERNIYMDVIDIADSSATFWYSHYDSPIEPYSSTAGYILTGRIIDRTTNTGLIGANVYERGTTHGVTCDYDGRFSLPVSSANAVIVISYIGYPTVEIRLNGNHNITVIMDDSSSTTNSTWDTVKPIIASDIAGAIIGFRLGPQSALASSLTTSGIECITRLLK